MRAETRAATEVAEVATRAYRWRWAALAVLMAAEAMNVLDSTIVQVAAPGMRADLGGAESEIQWFGAAYTLPFALLLVTGWGTWPGGGGCSWWGWRASRWPR